MSGSESRSSRANNETWVIDLDGVVWLAEQPIAGSADAVAKLRRNSMRVVFATNNAAPTVAGLLARLQAAGIEAGEDDVVTSAQAAAAMLEPGNRAYLCAEEGVAEALERRRVEVVDRGPVDAVVVSWTRRFDFDMLADAATLVRQGARLIGTNEDATHPTPGRLLPGSGAMLAAVATAAQTTPEVAGKPHRAMVELLRRRTSGTLRIVGDRPSTDGALARRLGAPFALVRSGVTSDGREPIVVQPDEDAPDLASLVSRHFA